MERTNEMPVELTTEALDAVTGGMAPQHPTSTLPRNPFPNPFPQPGDPIGGKL